MEVAKDSKKNTNKIQIKYKKNINKIQIKYKKIQKKYKAFIYRWIKYYQIKK
jgi:hypothetical protein